MARLLPNDVWRLREAIRIADIRGGSVHISRTMARRILAALRDKETPDD